MSMADKAARLTDRQKSSDQQTQTAVGVTIPIIVLAALILAYLFYWHRNKKMESRHRQRRSRRSRHGSNHGPTVSANDFILSDMWDDEGGFDPDPRRSTEQPRQSGAELDAFGSKFIRGDVWDDGGGFDPDPRRKRAEQREVGRVGGREGGREGGRVHNNHATEFLQDAVWNEGESNGHVDIHPSKQRQRRRHITGDGRRGRDFHRRDRHQKIDGDVWNDDSPHGHVDVDTSGRPREPSIAHSVTGNSHVFGTDEIDDRSFRTTTDGDDQEPQMPRFPAQAHRPAALANVDHALEHDLLSDVNSTRRRDEDQRIAFGLRLALQGDVAREVMR